MTASPPAQPAPAPDAARLEGYRAYLLRYARLQIRDAAAAEDLVQETLLAAIEGGGRFSGRSSLKTWLTGILKHKIIDHLRRQVRERPLIAGGEDPGHSEAEAVDALFAADGHWLNAAPAWHDPERALENKNFWDVFEMCAKLMPARIAQVFAMREVLELSTEEICKDLGITPTNCWVMLHRARLVLRECLDLKWFGKT